MWEFFEPELNRCLSMMEADDGYAARVRSALMELLPSGKVKLTSGKGFYTKLDLGIVKYHFEIISSTTIC